MTVLPKRILVGVSCDPECEGRATLCAADRHAFQHAAWLAEKTGADLRVIHVVDFLDERLSRDVDVAGEIERDLDEEMNALCHGTSATRVFRRGKAWEELIEEVRVFAADLLVVSPRREELRFADRIFHGSTTSRVLRHAPTSVWVVAPDARLPPARLLALVDGSPIGRVILETAEALADGLGLERHVLRCLDYPHDIALHRLPNAQRAIASYHREVREEAKRELEAMTTSAWRVHLGDDWVVRDAPKLVAAERIDLVVLATGEHPGLSGMLGLTAEKLLHRMPASAWLVRPAPRG
jgi:nucleotide-binding universal stress UspA family protein